ncbi:MAG: RNA methyltransferase [Clostridiales bacterium]|nr:RNA methyltransferase [Clostridiales bacterium]
MSETVITSRHNPLLVHVKKLQSSRSYRRKCGEFAADGTKLLEEAARWYPGLHTVIAQEGIALCTLPGTVRVARVPESIMRDISLMDTPQGALFICRLPEDRTAEIAPGSLLLDGVQDPGNLGTILRTADALDVPVVLLDGCADAYSAKTVRASMGAVFRTQPASMTREQALACCREKKIALLATAMSDDAVDLRTAPLARCAVVIGSEGQGVSHELLAQADGKIVIPMSARCESLNAAVAASIVMWQMKR